jgi:hypothetical protein
MTTLRRVLAQIQTFGLIVVFTLLGLNAAFADGKVPDAVLSGQIESNGTPLPGYWVGLYASVSTSDGSSQWEALGSGETDTAGQFHIDYPVLKSWPGAAASVLVVEATNGPVMLASAIGTADQPPSQVVVNELTTVATGASFAQFLHHTKIEGNTVGVMNAEKMATNFADPVTVTAFSLLRLAHMERLPLTYWTRSPPSPNIHLLWTLRATLPAWIRYSICRNIAPSTCRR